MKIDRQKIYCEYAKKIELRARAAIKITAEEESLDPNWLYWFFSTFVDEHADKVHEEMIDIPK